MSIAPRGFASASVFPDGAGGGCRHKPMLLQVIVVLEREDWGGKSALAGGD